MGDLALGARHEAWLNEGGLDLPARPPASVCPNRSLRAARLPAPTRRSAAGPLWWRRSIRWATQILYLPLCRPLLILSVAAYRSARFPRWIGIRGHGSLDAGALAYTRADEGAISEHPERRKGAVTLREAVTVDADAQTIRRATQFSAVRRNSPGARSPGRRITGSSHLDRAHNQKCLARKSDFSCSMASGANLRD